MVINYFQPPDATRDGVLVIDGEIRRTTGRLGSVGSRVFASGFRWLSADYDELRLLVQCERTGETAIAAEITAFGRGGTIFFTHCIGDIPLAIS